MMDDTPEVADALDNGGGEKRNSAATIDHTEVHVGITKKHAPGVSSGAQGSQSTVISTGNAGEPGVRYSTTESGLTQVIVQKPNPEDKPKDFVVTSCFVILFCNFLWGLAGWHFGLKANNAWQLGDEVECRRHAKKAKIFVILGVITGIITYVLVLTLLYTLSPLRPGA
ncbi:uncharacterized protein LOC128218310 [Mya arenaria]|uniref:uncharacterized protein LOC128218310 n=1 Tax=Mya arenaria TaxID=6604 RepID=UPI0022E0A8D1|nr:uncharacterized protein LOC128218310 [Mya arenaria]